MAVRVFSNNLPNPVVRDGVQRAVLQAVGSQQGDWMVQIHENQNSPSWHITLWGPNEYRWTREFFDLDEQSAHDDYGFIRKTISEVVSRRQLVVYLSYAYPDNSTGFVNSLSDRLAQELQVQGGEPAEVIWDPDRMRPSGESLTGVQRLAERATILVAIVSPSYFKSDLCRKEFELFLGRAPLGKPPAMIPVYFVTTEEFERAPPQTPIMWAQILKRNRVFDLRSQRFEMTSTKALQIIVRLATSIRTIFTHLSREQPGKTGAESEPIREGTEPVYVTSLRLENFRCFDALELKLNRPSTLEGRWTCIAGINGSGKSSVLQALAFALLGNPLALELGGERLNRMRRVTDGGNREWAKVEVELEGTGSNTPKSLNLGIGEGRIVSLTGPQFGPPSPTSAWDPIRRFLTAGYGATRNLSYRVDPASESLSRDVRSHISLFEPLSQLPSAEVLLGSHSLSWPFLDLFQKVIQQVFDAELQIALSSPPSDIRFIVSNKDNVEAIDLPDGFRSAVAWLADLCSIWCEKAPTSAETVDPADIHGIVLVDEIDLHLHASLQRSLIPKLRKTFPKVQWIVTTHSPLVLANFDVDEIIALDRREDGNIRELDRQILGFTSDEIYRWLMGTPPTGTAMEEENRKADGAVGKTTEEIARLMRISPTTDDNTAARQVNEFKKILETLKR